MTSGSYPWTGNLATGEREDFELPALSGLSGYFDYIVTLSQPNGVEDVRPLNNTLLRSFLTASEAPLDVEVIGGNNPCSSSNALLHVEVNDPSVTSIDWYVAATGGAVAGTGTYYLTPPLVSNFTFYAEVTLEPHGGIIHKDDTANEAGEADGAGLIFDAFTSFTLKSVKVFNATPGIRLISIRDESGANVATKTLNLPTVGEFVVDLDAFIPAGSGYTIKLNAGGGLYKSTAPSFPYIIGGVMSIQKSTDFVNSTDTYYYFYDWVIEHQYVCGRAPVEITFETAANIPSAAFEASTTVVNTMNPNPVNFTNNSTNGESYFWDFGDGTTSNAFEPSHIFNSVGTFTVALAVTGADGCSDTELIEIVVEEVVTSISELDAQNQIKVFPNPTQNRINVEFDFNENQNVGFYIVDLLGRRLSSRDNQNFQNDRVQIDLSDYTNGIYYLVFDIEGTKVVKKIVKMN